MRALFVFTAGNKVARENVRISIERPVDKSIVLQKSAESEHAALDVIHGKAKGFYLWGATPRPGNVSTWEAMEEGDWVLAAYGGRYRFVAKVLAKYRNADLAKAVWGTDDEGNTWECLYFLSPPTALNTPYADASDYLHKQYYGFTRISDDRLKAIEQEYGSLDRFIEEILMQDKPPRRGQHNHVKELEDLRHHMLAKGFVFEPWHVAAYVTALKTKPFVILAGVSGTGKSKLPKLLAEATGGTCLLVPVRPDWTDSSEILGYVDLQGRLRPGHLLRFALKAAQDPGRHYVCIVDEMNLARVEYYFAEVLSHIEDRSGSHESGFSSGPLLSAHLLPEDKQWADVLLPANLAIVGTVNMDETTHGFSRKVLDRAFTLELSDIDLEPTGPTNAQAPAISPWPARKWFPRALRLGGGISWTESERALIKTVVDSLSQTNAVLRAAQLQVGYRTRDEVALFVLHAQPIIDAFTTQSGDEVDPLDLALQMKILPRIAGGSAPIRRVVADLLVWAHDGSSAADVEDRVGAICRDWESAGWPSSLPDAEYPRTTARLCLMWTRLLNEGFTSFWL